MKSFQNFCNTYSWIIVALCCLITILLHVKNFGFPPLNSDEVSMGYNAYSIAETGKDEYGYSFPSRFKTFGEFKLPFSIYTMAVFIKVLGLSDFSTRLPFILVAVFSPVLFYFLTKKLFNNAAIGILAALLTTFSPWIQIMARHAHDNVFILVFTILALIVFVNLLNKVTVRSIVYLTIITGLVLFTSHVGKVLALYFAITLIAILIYKKISKIHITKYTVIFLLPIIFFIFTEIQNPTTRVSNLLFINNPGFTLSIEEMRREHNSRILHNKGTQAILELTNRYFTYFSPEFLVINGDENPRFGFKGISPITPVTYILVLIGLYFLFKNNEKYRFLIISLLLIAPFSASLSWQEYSLTRAFVMIIPLLLLAAYGSFYIVDSIKKYQLRLLVIFLLIIGYSFFTFYSWDFYYNHYPKKRIVLNAWQAGYKELNEYIKQNYSLTKQFYITKELGQPYIYTLFYLKFPPEQYQQQAELSALDEYGFGQVEQFDKFTFTFKKPTDEKNIVYIGFPHDFQDIGISENDVEKITFNNEEMFWIYSIK